MLRTLNLPIVFSFFFDKKNETKKIKTLYKIETVLNLDFFAFQQLNLRLKKD